MGTAKYGYFINPQGYHEPHNLYFDLIQQAFRMKVDHNKSNKEIADWLNRKGCKRRYIATDENGIKTFKELSIEYKALGEAWIDHFYYGKFIHGKNETDLRESNEYYKPMITEEDHAILYARHLEHYTQRASQEIKKENVNIYPFEKGIVITPDGYSMTANIPNKHRFFQRLEELKAIKPNADLSEVVNSNQVKY